MRTYELTVLVKAGAVSADEEGTLAAVRGLYETEGAEFIEFEKWEERKLAYPIQGETSALYMIGYFTAPSESLDKIERRVNLADNVLRHLIVVREEAGYQKIREQRAKALELAAAATEADDDGSED